MPVAERQQETGTRWLALRWPCRITGRIPGRVPGPERALTRSGEPVTETMGKDTGTDGQVGRHDGGERTRGRSFWLGCRELARSRGERTAAAAADLHGIAGGGPEKGPQPAEADAPVPLRRSGERAAGHGGQRWPQDGRGRRAGRAGRLGESRHGCLAAARRGRVEALACQAGVHPESGRETARPGDSRDRRQGITSPGVERAGTRVGGTVRAEVLRVPARPRLP